MAEMDEQEPRSPEPSYDATQPLADQPPYPLSNQPGYPQQAPYQQAPYQQPHPQAPYQQPYQQPYAPQYQQPYQPGPDQHLTDHLARYGAPVPPYAPAPQLSSAVPSAPPRRRGRRILAVGSALAVVAVAGGAGFALGHVDHAGPATAGAPPVGYAQTPGGQSQGGGTPNGENPFAGTPFSGTPFGGSGSQQGSPYDSGSGDAPASGSQLTGLVRISSTLKYEDGKAAGTGLVVSSTGEVITNHHVVQGSTSLWATVMTTGQRYRATVVGTDAKDDVAVIQLQNASGLQTVTTDDDGVSVGDAVTAVGDANGQTSTFSAASGKVMATNQHITTSSEDGRPGEKLSGLIEISSDVIPGDSGGATYDDQGEVVGMTTAASSGSSNTVGYAIPIATATRIAGDLENGTQNARYEYGSPAFLGIGLAGRSPRVGQVYPGTPAAEAGIAPGDTITGIGSTQVSTSTQLRAAVTTYSPGQQVQVSWTDAQGASHVATVTLMSGPIA